MVVILKGLLIVFPTYKNQEGFLAALGMTAGLKPGDSGKKTQLSLEIL